MITAADTIDRLARQGRARLLAFLVRRGGDLAAAEDALGDAYAQALSHWRRHGIPHSPEAWLLIVARRRLIDAHRAARRRERTAAALLAVTAEAEAVAGDEADFPDERLRLLFACTHPALERGLHAPLMLQVVMGVDAARIAACLLVRPATLGQRLVRAKARLRRTAAAFENPGPAQLPSRLPAVLEAIYAAFTLGWDREPRTGPGAARGLAAEALQLARSLAQWLPEQPEILGLLALMLHCRARAEASRREGRYVPLASQDCTLWDGAAMAEADALLAAAARRGEMGRYQLEAAIQGAHNQRRHGAVEWRLIVLLYSGLLTLAPTLGARLGHAAALAEVEGTEAAWQAVTQISGAEDHQPYWALRAALARRTNRAAEAEHALALAIGLCDDPAVRAHLMELQGM